MKTRFLLTLDANLVKQYQREHGEKLSDYYDMDLNPTPNFFITLSHLCYSTTGKCDMFSLLYETSVVVLQ